MTTFKQAADAWYATANKWGKFGSSDTEPRAEFADIVIDLAKGVEPTIPTTVGGWQLYSEMKGNGLAAAALTRAAKKVVAVGKTDHMGLMAYVRMQGWAGEIW